MHRSELVCSDTGCNHLSKGPAGCGVAGWEGTISFVLTRAVGPESSAPVALVGTLSIAGELQPLHYQQSIDDRFLSQTPSLGKVIIVSCRSKQVEPAGTGNRSVKANLGDRTASVYSSFNDSKILLHLCIIMKRNTRSRGKWYQPDRVLG